MIVNFSFNSRNNATFVTWGYFFLVKIVTAAETEESAPQVKTPSPVFVIIICDLLSTKQPPDMKTHEIIKQ
jgi:hypothetical protein